MRTDNKYEDLGDGAIFKGCIRNNKFSGLIQKCPGPISSKS